MAIFNLQYIYESKIKSDISSAENFARLFYCHCLKWKYQQSRQGNSWLDTIRNSHRNLKSLMTNTNVKNKINSKINDIYLNGLNDAISETKLYIIDDEVKLVFATVDDIINTDKLYTWLVEYWDESKVSEIIL